MELLKELVMAVSPSGRENNVREIIKNQLSPYCDEVYTDALGNLICHRRGNGKKLMFAAHMDEIGFMVNYIDDNGGIRKFTIHKAHKSVKCIFPHIYKCICIFFKII